MPSAKHFLYFLAERYVVGWTSSSNFHGGSPCSTTTFSTLSLRPLGLTGRCSFRVLDP